MSKWFLSLPTITFASPWWLVLLPLLVLILWLKKVWQQRQIVEAIYFPDVQRFAHAELIARRWMVQLPQWLRWATLVVGIVLLAEPRITQRTTVAATHGIDMVVALDISESMMQVQNNTQSRFEIAREAARKIVEERSNDRIGLVVFRGEAYTLSPLTRDHAVLSLLLNNLSSRIIQDDGTAIGSALLVALNRLQASESQQRVVLLLTDGENNAGEVSPLTAAALAVRRGVRLYVLNVAFTPFDENRISQVESNATQLQAMAHQTGGSYFTIANKAELEATIASITANEKNRYSKTIELHHKSLMQPLLLTLLLLFVIELLLSTKQLLKIPS